MIRRPKKRATVGSPSFPLRRVLLTAGPFALILVTTRISVDDTHLHLKHLFLEEEVKLSEIAVLESRDETRKAIAETGTHRVRIRNAYVLNRRVEELLSFSYKNIRKKDRERFHQALYQSNPAIRIADHTKSIMELF